jgi:peptidoglycan/LPS O-acetylase OafA/YrhL
VLGHLRYFVLVDAGKVEHFSAPWKLFYFIAGFGHQAVMIFFVLSGFLVGKNIYDACKRGQWSWTDYAIKRLSRLWIVLIPALVLTAVWDQIGIHVFHGAIYAAPPDAGSPAYVPPAGGGSIYGPATFFANAFFLQTIVAPSFGTNGPLWSLANEFWYYVIFPLCFLAVRSDQRAIKRIGFAALALTICLLLPGKIVLYGIVWLMGFGVVVIRDRTRFTMSAGAFRALAVTSTVLFLAGAAIGRFASENSFWPDVACGLTFAVFLYCLTRIQLRKGILTALSKVLSDFSYTLYLTHFPFLAVLSCAVLKGARLQPGFAGLAVYSGFLCGVLLYSYVVYLLFERNTRVVQTTLSRRWVRLNTARV